MLPAQVVIEICCFGGESEGKFTTKGGRGGARCDGAAEGTPPQQTPPPSKPGQSDTPASPTPDHGENIPPSNGQSSPESAPVQPRMAGPILANTGVSAGVQYLLMAGVILLIAGAGVVIIRRREN